MVSGAYNRKKGADFERELVHQFRNVMPGAPVKRGLQCRGAEMADVDMPVFWPEAKRMKRPNIRKAYEQAVGDCPKGKIPLAITRANHDQALVTMSLDDFLDFVGEWWESRDK